MGSSPKPAQNSKERHPLGGALFAFGAPRQSKSEPVLFFAASFTSSKVTVLVCNVEWVW